MALPDACRQGNHHGSLPARLNLGPRISGLRLLDHRGGWTTEDSLALENAERCCVSHSDDRGKNGDSLTRRYMRDSVYTWKRN